MATITGLTKEKIEELIDGTVVSAAIVAGDLILTMGDASTVNVGSIWATDNWAAFTPVFDDLGSMTVTPIDDTENSARYLSVGQLCFVQFSQKVTLGGTIQQQLAIHLPVAKAAASKGYFPASADVCNAIARGFVSPTGSPQKALLIATHTPWTASTFVLRFSAFYEI